MPTPSLQRLFIEYYTAYRDRIYTFFWYRVNGDRALAEDLCADVFLKAFDNLDRFDPEREFRPWLYAIAWNHLKNHYRTRGREVSLAAAANVACPRSSDPAAALECERLIATINTLDEYSRDVLLARYVDGLSHREIAAVLGKNEEAIRAQASRALRVLRNKLRPDL